MFKEAISKKMLAILSPLSQIKKIKQFYLAGGTALALQLGHRKSIDLDFFTYKKFNNKILKLQLQKIGKVEIITDEEDTLNIIISDVKVSFFYYPYKNISNLIEFNKIKLASCQDISAMKLEAISGRGSKKDFIDLFFLTKDSTLKQILSIYKNKYKGISYNELHIIKSLTYFVDADKEPMPIMLKPINWTQIKKELISEVKKLL